MKTIFLASVFALFACACTTASASDRVLHLDIRDVLDPGYSAGKLDGSVKFYLTGQTTPRILKKLGADVSNKKTNGVTRGDAEACKWVMLSALIALQQGAKARGANAVVDIKSYYKKVEFVSATQYECHAGNIMSGVALKGTYANVASK